MAARENQGYLIAVIILVLLTLVSALVAFLGIQKAYEQAEVAEASDGKLKVALEIAKAEGLKGEAYKAVIGDLGAAPPEINKAIQDLQALSTNSALTDADKKLVEDILAEVRTVKDVYDQETGSRIDDDQGAKVETLRSRIADLIALVDRIRKDFKNEGRRADDAKRDAEAKVNSLEETLASTRAEMDKLNQKVVQQAAEALVNENKLKEEARLNKEAFQEAEKKGRDAVQQANTIINNKENQVALLEEENKNLKRTLNQLTREVFDHADGKVIRVASGLGRVFIDIGGNDGLTGNRTFTVYDRSVTDFKTATSKATIEVINVNPFRSEARVTSENVVDPILPGDHVLTATWDPGFSVKYALAGRFDLDNDGFDDTEKLIRMIERNGGEVIASHDRQGKINGKVTPEVRYLVTGNAELIGGQEDDPDAGAILNAVRAMEADAEKNTVQIIDLQKLLNRIGVRAQPKTTQLDFPPGGFQPRQPGGSGTRPLDGSDTRQPAGSGTRQPAGSGTR